MFTPIYICIYYIQSKDHIVISTQSHRPRGYIDKDRRPHSFIDTDLRSIQNTRSCRYRPHGHVDTDHTVMSIQTTRFSRHRAHGHIDTDHTVMTILAQTTCGLAQCSSATQIDRAVIQSSPGKWVGSAAAAAAASRQTPAMAFKRGAWRGHGGHRQQMGTTQAEKAKAPAGKTGRQRETSSSRLLGLVTVWEARGAVIVP